MAQIAQREHVSATISLELTNLTTIRYDTIAEFNVDSKAEY